MKQKTFPKPTMKGAIALTLIFLLVSIFPISLTYASPSATETDARRLTMLEIAEQYRDYTWTATSDNVWHASTSSYGNGKTTEPGPGSPYTTVGTEIFKRFLPRSLAIILQAQYFRGNVLSQAEG